MKLAAFSALIWTAFFAVSSVHAQNLISNASFETPEVATGSFAQAPEWMQLAVTSGYGYVLEPTDAQLPNRGNVDGDQVGLVFGANQDWLQQVTSATLQNNTTYTLTFYLGTGADAPPTFDLSVNVFALASGDTSIDAADILFGNFYLGVDYQTDGAVPLKMFTFGFTTGAADPQAGETIGLQFTTTDSTLGHFTYVDNVSLTATAVVPEPSSMELLVMVIIFFSGGHLFRDWWSGRRC